MGVAIKFYTPNILYNRFYFGRGGETSSTGRGECMRMFIETMENHFVIDLDLLKKKLDYLNTFFGIIIVRFIRSGYEICKSVSHRDKTS